MSIRRVARVAVAVRRSRRLTTVPVVLIGTLILRILALTVLIVWILVLLVLVSLPFLVLLLERRFLLKH